MPRLSSGHEATDGGVPTIVLNWDGRVMRNAFLTFGVVVVLVSTGMFSNLHGIQEGIIRPLFLQASPFVTMSSYSPAYYVQILFIYETVVVVFAFVRVLYSGRPKGLFSWFLVWWAFASLVFYSVLSQKSALLVIHALIPTALLAGEAIGELADWVESQRPLARLLLPSAVLTGITLPLLVGLLHVLNHFSLPNERMPWEVTVALVLVLALAIVGFVRWQGVAEAGRLGGAYLFVILMMIYVHVGSNLNFRGQLSPMELLVPSVAVEDIRNLAADLSDLERLAGDPSVGKGIFVEGRLQYPLAWYLRQLQGIEYAPTPSGNPSVVVAKEGFPVGPGQRASQRYLALASWEPRQFDWATLWRWLVYREPAGPLRYEVAEVSVRR